MNKEQWEDLVTSFAGVWLFPLFRTPGWSSPEGIAANLCALILGFRFSSGTAAHPRWRGLLPRAIAGKDEAAARQTPGS